jgi:Arc/MetJ family transcription regulator
MRIVGVISRFLTSLYHDIKLRVVRTTVSLDDDVYAAALQLSKTSGERLGVVLSKLARRGLKPRNPRVVAKRRFPVFDVPADAPPIKASTVQKIIDEEGLL